MDDEIEPSPKFVHLGEHRIERVRFGDVATSDDMRAKFGREWP